MKLYSYWRSSCSYRVRIALNLKGLDYETEPVHLLEGGGQQKTEAYAALNPAAQVPTLVLDNGTALTQSMAIIEYLDEVHPEPRLLPSEPVARARVRAQAELVNAGIQPLQNLSVLGRIEALGGSKVEWSRHFIGKGLRALEALAGSSSAAFLSGDAPGLADIMMVPQLYNARRFEMDMAELPRLVAVDGACQELEAFKNAHPDNQPDTPKASK